MKQTIYIDILVGVNLFINYFLLLITAHFMCAKWKPIRLVFGELLSGLFSLYILIPEINIFLSIIVKILMSVIIVLTDFDEKHVSEITKSFNFLNLFYTIKVLVNNEKIDISLTCPRKYNDSQE